MSGWFDGLDDMDQALLDPVSGFGALVVIELASGEVRADVKAIIDIESKNADLKGGGSIRGVVGKAEVSAADASGIRKGDVLIHKDVRYSIVSHPVQLDQGMYQLDLGFRDGQQTTVPDIRY